MITRIGLKSVVGKENIMKKDNLILSLWMLLVLLIMLSTCCEELKEDYKHKRIVNYNTVKEIDTQEQETENKPKIELQASYRMDEHGNLVKVYEKEP